MNMNETTARTAMPMRPPAVERRPPPSRGPEPSGLTRQEIRQIVLEILG